MRFSRRLSVVVIRALAVGLVLAAAPVSAQTFGVRVGASFDPDQFFFGGHFETKPIIENVTFRPNVEIGIGHDITVTCLNFEFAYKFPSTKPWNVYAGGGPALNLIYTDQRDHAEGGFTVLLGVEHRQGLFAEIKAGALDSPNFKILVGYAIH